MMETVYQTKVAVTGGRNGKIKSDDGILELNVKIPVSMGGKVVQQIRSSYLLRAMQPVLIVP